MKKNQFVNIINSWRNYYASLGLTKEEADKLLNYAEPLIRKELPPIFDIFHLGLLMGVDHDFLMRVINGSDSFYRNFIIPKRNGGQREITAPYPSLKYLQRWILDNILIKAKIHGCVHGFTKGKSIVSNASMHIGQDVLFKIDLQDFFPSISINYIIQTFKSMGYSQKVAFYLASLCCHKGHLPQGSPASPMLSNIVAYHLDRRLYRLAKKFGLKYSRYADDIAFSGKSIDQKFINYVINIILDCNFYPNLNKTRLYKSNQRKILTGINIANSKLKLPRNYRRKLIQELYYIDKFGLWNHMKNCHIDNPNYPQSILGKINYFLMIEPDNEFAKRMHNSLKIYLPSF